MKLNSVLRAVSAVLAFALLIQGVVLMINKPRERWIASWANSPKTVDEVKDLAKQIVKGRVINIRAGEDLVMKVTGEPNNEDRIPVEVITIALEGAYKGATPKTVEVFHTGLSPLDVKGRKIPPRPADVKPGKVAKPSRRETSTVSLDDAPPYRVGEQYVLFLMDGPDITVAGSRVQTQALTSPEGRFVITADNKLSPVTKRHFTDQLSGQEISALEKQLPKLNPLPVKEWHPSLQQLRIKQLEERKQLKQLMEFKKQIQ